MAKKIQRHQRLESKGMPVKTVAVYLTQVNADRVNKLAVIDGISVSGYLARKVTEILEREEKK